MNTNVQKPLPFFEEIITNNIDLEAYDKESKNIQQDIREVYRIFISEKAYEIKRVGTTKAFTDWLQGLPSVLTVPFMYHEQLKLAEEKGVIGKNLTEIEQDDFLQSFFHNCTKSFFNLLNNSYE